MRIMYLTDQVFLHGGVEKVLSQKANWFADINGDEVWIVTTRQQEREPVYRFNSKIKWRDLGVDYQIKNSYFSKVNLRKIPAHFRKLKNAIKEINPDVIVSCNFAPDFYFLPKLSPQIPKIKEFHGSRALRREPKGIKSKALSLLDFKTEAMYDALAVLNPDELRYFPSGNPVVIPNPAENSIYCADIKAKKILAAGRISPVKNFAELIEIFSMVTDGFPEWQLHIYGEDYLSTQEKLENLISKYSLNDKIFFKGVSTNLKQTMQDYSIYAMTSETECFPMVLLEALSCGLPIISYDCPTGPANIVSDDSDGILVPNKKMNSFAEALKKIMANETLRENFSLSGRENVRRFEVDKVMKKWESLFKSLIEK